MARLASSLPSLPFHIVARLAFFFAAPLSHCSFFHTRRAARANFTNVPVPITALKTRKVALKRPTEWLLFSSNTTESNGDLTQLSFAFRDVIIRLPIISCIECSLRTCSEILWTIMPVFIPSCSFLCNAAPSTALAVLKRQWRAQEGY